MCSYKMKEKRGKNERKEEPTPGSWSVLALSPGVSSLLLSKVTDALLVSMARHIVYWRIFVMLLSLRKSEEIPAWFPRK